MWQCKEPPIGSSWIGKKNQCHVPWKTIVLPAPSQALLISLIIAWRDKEIRTGWKSDKSDNGVYYAWIKEGKGGVGIWYRNFFVWFHLEIEGMFDDSIMLNKYYVKYKYTSLNPSKQRHPYTLYKYCGYMLAELLWKGLRIDMQGWCGIPLFGEERCWLNLFRDN